MKFFFASDLHGSAFACEQILARFEAEKADRLFLLGDLLYHGPRNDLPECYRPKEVIQMLNAFATAPLCVRGNCDAEIDQMVLSFPIMADYALLPLTDACCAFLTHGHLFNTALVPPHKAGDVLIHGHTHIHGVFPREDYVYINPGSAALPKEGQPKSYMGYEDGAFEIKGLEDGKTLVEYRLEETL